MAEKKDVLDVLFPGTELVLNEGEDGDDSNPRVACMVYPVGIYHMKRFSTAVEEVLPKIAAQMDLSKVGDNPISDLQAMVIPILLSDGLDIIQECVSGVTITDKRFPHWWMPKILDKWIEISFGKEEQIRPWIEVVDNAITRMTGEPAGIWDTLCASVAKQASALKMSSEEITASRTEE